MFEEVLEALKTCLGESLVYKGDGSLDHSFVGVFDENFTFVDPQTGEKVSSQQVSILLKLTDLPEIPANRKQFVARGGTYLVTRTEKDGKGGARVFLMEKDS